VNLSAGWVELNKSLKQLRLRWDEVAEHWQDSVREEFETDHLVPLETQVVATLRALDRLAPILAKAQRECS
jgi:hypothetical protein